MSGAVVAVNSVSVALPLPFARVTIVLSVAPVARDVKVTINPASVVLLSFVALVEPMI